MRLERAPDSPVPKSLACCSQRGGDGGGMVCIIVDQRNAAPTPDVLKTTTDAAKLGQTVANLLLLDAQMGAQCGSGQRIEDVVVTRNLQQHFGKKLSLAEHAKPSSRPGGARIGSPPIRAAL